MDDLWGWYLYEMVIYIKNKILVLEIWKRCQRLCAEKINSRLMFRKEKDDKKEYENGRRGMSFDQFLEEMIRREGKRFWWDSVVEFIEKNHYGNLNYWIKIILKNGEWVGLVPS